MASIFYVLSLKSRNFNASYTLPAPAAGVQPAIQLSRVVGIFLAVLRLLGQVMMIIVHVCPGALSFHRLHNTVDANALDLFKCGSGAMSSLMLCIQRTSS